MPDDFLKTIVAHKKAILKEKKDYLAILREKIKGEKLNRYQIFKKAISKSGGINLIAEIKKASPSRGIIRNDFDALNLARVYMKSGAVALSVLTEEKFFLGKPMYLRHISDNLSIPLLAKDFFIDEVQIFEACSLGASAILLICNILSEKELKHLMAVAADLDIDCLVEVHDEKDLEKALAVNAEIIGINNRDLHTFETDFNNCLKILPKIPKEKITVVESGLKSHEEIMTLKKLGVHAVLIGETFLRASDVEMKIKEVMRGV